MAWIQFLGGAPMRINGGPMISPGQVFENTPEMTGGAPLDLTYVRQSAQYVLVPNPRLHETAAQKAIREREVKKGLIKATAGTAKKAAAQKASKKKKVVTSSDRKDAPSSKKKRKSSPASGRASRAKEKVI
jgi:hypothetical protein